MFTKIIWKKEDIKKCTALYFYVYSKYNKVTKRNIILKKKLNIQILFEKNIYNVHMSGQLYIV